MEKGLLRDARTLSREDFIARHPGLFLIIGAGDEGVPVGFQTLASKPIAQAAGSPGKGEARQILPIVKARGHPYPDRISVGRTRNCDLVLRDPSVSKLHAHFRPRAGGGFDLVDLGSKNGTSVNGQPLSPNEPEQVVADDAVQFGTVSGTLVDALGLLDLALWM